METHKKKILVNILKNLNIKKGDNIYLGLDFLKLYQLLGMKIVDRNKFVEQIFKFFLSYIGKKVI